jgi:transposase
MGRLQSGSHDHEEPPRRFLGKEVIVRRVGIDLALKAPHRAVVFDGPQPVGKSFRVERSKAGIDELIRRATAGVGEGPCEFIMEPTGLAWLPLAAELALRGHRTYVPKPQKTHALRKFLSQFAKTDAVDAKAQALVRHVDPDGVHELRVPTAQETTLRLCTKQRARLVAEAARAKSRIQSWLVLASPFLVDAFGDDLFTELGTALLRRFVDPFAVRALGRSELRRFWQRQAHRSAHDEQFEKVWAACEKACELYEAQRAAGKLPFDYAVLQSMVSAELERIEFLERQAAALETTIRDAYRAVDPERMLEREVPGIGPTIAPLIEAFGSDVERFGSAKRFAAFFGFVPRTKQTGGKDGKPRQRLTKGGPRLLKQYLFLAAETARRCDPELAATYEQALARGKHHYSAVIIVAHKLLRKIYALLKLRATARRQQAAGRPAPALQYRFCDAAGAPLSRAEARAYVQAHFPSKAAKLRRAKKKAVEAAPQTSSKAQTGTVPQTGSSEDVTNEDGGAPPTQLVAKDTRCGKAGELAVANPLTARVNFPLDAT